jgi:putative redox protein
MIHSTSESTAYRTHFSDGAHQGLADTTVDKGGRHAGFRPHDLLETALATCINMTVRMYADRHAIPLRSVQVKVSLDRGNPEEVAFRYEVEMGGELSDAQRDRLAHAARSCPVSQTLRKRIRVEAGPGAVGG